MNEETATPVEGTPAEGEQVESGSVTQAEVLQALGKEVPAETAEEETPTEEQPVDEETPAVEVEEEAPKEEPVKPVEPPASVAEIETPSFNLEVEDASGNKLVIEPGANLEEVLKDFEPKSNGQIFQIIKDVMRLEGEKSEWEKSETEKTQQADYDARVAQVQQGWESEIKALQGQKRIGVTADGKPNERVDTVFKFMAEENAKRSEVGRPLLQSFEDALDKLELKEKREGEVQAAKDAKETARKNGGLVGGSSAPASSGAPVYKGGARNATDAVRAMGLL